MVSYDDDHDGYILTRIAWILSRIMTDNGKNVKHMLRDIQIRDKIPNVTFIFKGHNIAEHRSYLYCMKSLKMSKGLSDSVYRRRTGKTMAERKSKKSTNNNLQNIHIKLKIK